MYGEANRLLRCRPWNLLKKLAKNQDLPWSLIRDFNCILSQREKRRGHAYPSNLVSDFDQVVDECQLTEIQMSGYQFTWERGVGTSNWMKVKLDRALGNPKWIDIMSPLKVQNLCSHYSDHNPLLLIIGCEKLLNERLFRFNNQWILEDGCQEIIQNYWDHFSNDVIMQKLNVFAKELSN